VKKTILLSGLLLAASPAQGQTGDVSKVGTTAAPFLEIPVGARAIGMGGAFVGTSDDVTALYWNPAGVARLNRSEAMFTHAEWIADMKFDYAAVAVSLEEFGWIGLSFTSLSMGDMLVRTVDQPEGTGEVFDAGSFAAGIHYARNLSDKFSIGISAKYISERIWNMHAGAFAIDVGTLFVTNFLNGMRIGAAVSNFGTEMKLEGRDARTFHPVDPSNTGGNDRIPQNIEMNSWHLPLNFQFGVAVDAIKTDNHLLTLAVDALHPTDNYESLNVGAEYSFQKLFFLRGGYQSLFLTDAEGGLSLGTGILAPLFGETMSARVDYGYSDFGRLEAIHILAVSVLF